MLEAGEFVDEQGDPVPAGTPFVPRTVVWAHRDLPDEGAPPEDVTVLHRDDRLVVVDKPHFMATAPRGRHVVQTALARTRVLTGLPRLAPAHRLDRLTAGVLLLTTEQRWRGAYQQAFAERGVQKEYLAVAPVRDDLELPLVRRTHLLKEHGVHQAREVPGRAPNAETSIELIERRGGVGLYRLRPHTGRTHQLRAQLNGLGIPIVGDSLYPLDRGDDEDDLDVDGLLRGLYRLADAPDGLPEDAPRVQLFALELDDPVDGTRLRFVTRRRLSAWPPH